MSVDTEPKPQIKRKSFTYKTAIEWLGNRAGTTLAEGKPSFRTASPPEFKGEPNVWSPEDLFVAALNACTMTTFVSFALKLELPVASFRCEAEGTLEFVDGGLRFTKVVLRPEIVVADAGAVEQVRKTMDDAHHACLIARSIKAEVIVEANIHAA